ncbi:hypothetical protein G7Y89_g13416 [Cudoniella acicularis]|uniref:Uncharacterized protein n=1 Tax=Cudoniella acicularis TaxID=354080 RepID=A0A8H4R7G7_9HELO|nr:hypothetical protein G7Y89_g13416 [Cudoniella acicularis]
MKIRYRAHCFPVDYSEEYRTLVGDHTYDPLSNAILRTFSQSQNLTSLTLTEVFDSSLFWPLSHQSSGIYFTDPSGSDLEDVPLPAPEDSDSDGSSDWKEEASFDEFDKEEYDGLCGSSPYDVFCAVPDSSRIGSLILGFAKDIQHMPSLSLAAITTRALEGPDGDTFQFEIGCYAPNQPAVYGDQESDDQKVRRLYFEVGDWRPDEELLEALRERWATLQDRKESVRQCYVKFQWSL